MRDIPLYHGSTKKLIGDKLIPKPAQDLGERPENLHTAVYATSMKEAAIAMALISCEGVITSSLYYKTPYGVIYEGWPKQRFIYLYTLPSKTFVQSKKGSKQYHSLEQVKPLRKDKLLVKDYLSLIRKATDKEIERFNKKYGNN
jgi:hypothetical protein